jgi:hypothetical protein
MKLKPRLILFISLGLLIGASYYAHGIPPSPPGSSATQASLHIDDILTAIGVASEATHLGTFTGSTVPDSSTAKAAIQALETAVETKQAALSTTAKSIHIVNDAGQVTVLTCNGANQLIGRNAANNAWECKTSLSISALDMTSSTSSIPFPVGTASAPTGEGSAYWNSTTDILTVGDGAAAQAMMKASGTQNLATTGTIQGGIKISSDADGMTGAEMSAAGVYGTLFLATGAGTWTLPTAVQGMNVCLMDTGTAHDLILDVQAADTLMFNGTEDSAGDGITNASGSSTGDKICVVAYAAGKWIVTSSQGTWVAQ